MQEAGGGARARKRWEEAHRGAALGARLTVLQSGRHVPQKSRWEKGFPAFQAKTVPCLIVGGSNHGHACLLKPHRVVQIGPVCSQRKMEALAVSAVGGPQSMPRAGRPASSKRRGAVLPQSRLHTLAPPLPF